MWVITFIVLECVFTSSGNPVFLPIGKSLSMRPNWFWLIHIAISPINSVWSGTKRTWFFLFNVWIWTTLFTKSRSATDTFSASLIRQPVRHRKWHRNRRCSAFHANCHKGPSLLHNWWSIWGNPLRQLLKAPMLFFDWNTFVILVLHNIRNNQAFLHKKSRPEHLRAQIGRMYTPHRQL